MNGSTPITNIPTELSRPATSAPPAPAPISDIPVTLRRCIKRPPAFLRGQITLLHGVEQTSATEAAS